MTFNTDHSLLQGDLKLSLNNGTFSDFSDKVRWDMTLMQGSQLSGYDISYFVTDWDNYKPINVSGNMTGPLNKFYLDNFLVRNPSVNIKTKTMKVTNILKKPEYFLKRMYIIVTLKDISLQYIVRLLLCITLISIQKVRL